jgi:hypothetical protein
MLRRVDTSMTFRTVRFTALTPVTGAVMWRCLRWKAAEGFKAERVATALGCVA